MKKRMGAVLLSTAAAIVMAICFFGKSSAEQVNPKRIHTVRLDNENVPYDVSAWKDAEAKLGTATNPFVILELVPNGLKGENGAFPGDIGYLISGCEPVEINRFETRERVEKFSEMTTSVFGFTNQFFIEEKDSFLKEWGMTEEEFRKIWEEKPEESVSLFGYYERVEDGKGDFIWQKDRYPLFWDGNVELNLEWFEKGTGTQASWVWHTMENFEKNNTEKTDRQKSRIIKVEEGDDYVEDTDKIGSRIYTYRTDKGCYDGKDTYLYQHYEDFMRSSLRLLKKAERDNFYTIVKTITAEELNKLYTNQTPNAQNDWVAAANLIYVYGNNGAMDYEGRDDLSWESVMAIMKRVASDSNPAVFWADSSLLNIENTPESSRKDNVTYHAFDWSGNYQKDLNRGGQGSCNNLFKLGIMLSRWDARLFYSFFIQGDENEAFSGNWIDEKGNLIADKDRGGSYLSDEEISYWGKGSFLPVYEEEKREEVWEKYHVDTASEEITSNYIYKNILFYNTTKENRQDFLSGALTNQIDNRDRFHKDFFEYLKEENIPIRISGGDAEYVTYNYLVFNYILKDTLNGQSMQKTSLRILDLEPCNDFSSLTEFKIKTLFSNVNVSVEKIEIVRQTTAEFIGRIEDLISTYDLIYLGMDDKALRRGNGELKDYVYLHVGDKVKQRDDKYPVDWITPGNKYLRLPGNDITVKMRKELENYVKAGYPVIFAEDFERMEDADSKKKVDKASNIYEFVKNVENKDNVYYEEDLKKLSSLPEYLNKRKLEIDILEAPAEYAQDGQEGNYIEAETSGPKKGNYYLNYKFHLLAGESGKSYTARLYLDVNRDGRFASGEVVAKSQKSFGLAEEAQISTYVSNEWFGAIPWKLEVRENNGTQKAAVTGICAAKRTKDTEKKVIEVLQVMQKSNTSEINNWAKSTINLQDSNFKNLMENLEDYEINVTTVTITEFENIFKKGEGTGSRGYEGSKKKVRIVPGEETAPGKIGLENFTMLVFGFADDYTNISNDYGALEWVKAYIAMGKSVLFTHDNTSFFNTEADGKKNKSDYNFTRYFRGIMGMDRFDIRYQLHGQETDKKQRVESAGTTDTAYVLNDTTKVYEEQQGYTYYAARRIAVDKEGTKVGFTGMTNQGYETYLTTAVENVNNGQITRYPYYIKDNFEIAATHGQYYQLNMENEEIVVWYTLKNGGNNHGNTYDCSPRDTSNNYYIYNKGNITYTGIGHSNNPTEMERKLLVNTIIAAYKPAPLPPYFEFPDADFIEETNEGILCYNGYLNFDYGSTEETVDDLIPFIPMASGEGGEKLSVGIYQIYPEGKENVLCEVWDSDGNQVTDKQGDKVPVWMLENGKTYFVKCDKSAYESGNPKLLFTIEKKESESVMSRGKDTKLTIYRRELFNLD